MRGVVTGGAGFLGSHVTDVLVEHGHNVLVADLATNPRHASMRVDLGDIEALTTAFRGRDYVCHLGAIGDVYLAGDKPTLAASTNVIGTANVCEAALAAGVPTVVYASTWEVYGEPSYQPLDEEHPCAPDHPYSITKLAGERLALAYAHMREGLRVTSLRLGTAYGTRMRPNSVFSIFIAKALRHEPITIQGTGEQGRQFTHARDIADAFVRAIVRAPKHVVYNVVADQLTTIRQLAQLVAAELPTEVAFGPARKADVPSATVSNSRIRQELGWEAAVPFDAGLKEIIEDARRLTQAR